MAGMPPRKRELVGRLWNEFRRENPSRSRDGQMFVRILEHVATNEVPTKRRFVKKWQHHYFGNAPDNLGQRNLERGKLIFEQATCSRCHNIGSGKKTLGPDLNEITKRFRGSKLLQQIVKPSAEIHKEYQTQMIVDDEGRLQTGLVIKETDDEIVLLPNLLKPDKVRDDQERRDRATQGRRSVDDANGFTRHLQRGRDTRPTGIHPVRKCGEWESEIEVKHSRPVEVGK